MITIAQAEIALAVARSRSFREAAQSIFLSEPAVRGQIGKLEETLKITMFDRSRSGVVLTHGGRGVIPLLESFVASRDDIVLAGRRPEATTVPLLRIASHRAGQVTTLPAALAMVRGILGAIEVELVSANEVPQLYELLRAHAVEIVLSYRAAGIENPDLAIVEVEISVAPTVVFMPADHRLAANESVAFADLAGEVMIQIKAPTNRALTALAAGDQPFPQVYLVNDSQAALAMVGTGIGLTMLTSSVEVLAPPGVVHRPLSSIDRPVATTIARRRDDPLSPAADVMWRLLTNRRRRLP